MKSITLIERNRYGAWVIYGEIGMRQYYFYTKREAMQRYRNECKERKGN